MYVCLCVYISYMYFYCVYNTPAYTVAAEQLFILVFRSKNHHHSYFIVFGFALNCSVDDFRSLILHTFILNIRILYTQFPFSPHLLLRSKYRIVFYTRTTFGYMF